MTIENVSSYSTNNGLGTWGSPYDFETLPRALDSNNLQEFYDQPAASTSSTSSRVPHSYIVPPIFPNVPAASPSSSWVPWTDEWVLSLAYSLRLSKHLQRELNLFATAPAGSGYQYRGHLGNDRLAPGEHGQAIRSTPSYSEARYQPYPSHHTFQMGSHTPADNPGWEQPSLLSFSYPHTDVEQGLYPSTTHPEDVYAVERSEEIEKEKELEEVEEATRKETKNTPSAEKAGFSTLTSDQFKALGVKSTNLGTITGAQFSDIVAKSYIRAAGRLPGHQEILDKAIEAAWTKEVAYIETGLKTAVDNFGAKPEKWVIYVLTTIIGALSRQSNKRLVCLFELPLSWSLPRKNDTGLKLDLDVDEKQRMENPTVLLKCDSASSPFSLTGMIDIMVITLEEGCVDEGSRRTMKSCTTIDEVFVQGILKERTDTQLLLIEAKAFKHTENLDDHLPQIITEALVTAKKTGRTAVSWCLTSGPRWYFGVASAPEDETTKDSAVGSRYRVTYFEAEQVELQCISDSDSAEADGLEAAMRKMKTIWTMLTFWVGANHLVGDFKSHVPTATWTLLHFILISSR
ncbi:hypothetical protein DFP72DRAFT_1124468 [Ephemerocybe angulata]|uniref:Uncharacterized protein n=1 Tax=Ephemerocybe angulata TaxID=980116 RepID=A0A8H6HXG8_9AGAR|nr:hypothetical protein DFP72DRAFT_1124468 [Tulosesus angulatus]